MSTPHINGRMEKNIVVSYICSKCNNPVIEIVKVKTEGWINGINNSSEYNLQKNLSEKIEFEINRINRIKNNPVLLEPQVNKVNPMHYGPYTESFISGYDKCCPLCYSYEPWQSNQSTLAFSDLKDENYPIVYKSFEKAEKQAFSFLNDKINERNNKTLSLETIENAKSELNHLIPELSLLNNEINNISEIKELVSLREKKDNLVKEKASIRLFDIKGRKEIIEKINSIQAKINDLDDVVHKKLTKFNNRIKHIEIRILSYKAIAYGYSGAIKKAESYSNLCYYAEPNTIPDEELLAINGTSEKQTSCSIQESVITKDDNIKNEETVNTPEELINDIPVFCRKCGFKLLEDSIYCAKCGTKIK